MTIFEADKPNNFVIRNKADWVDAVKVSCSGEVKFLGKAKYRHVEITIDHPIFTTYDDTSSISKHMGWQLLAKKCHFSPDWISKFDSEPSFDPFYNAEALYPLANTKLTAPNGRFGMIGFPRWDNGQDPTILFVRRDKKYITEVKVETLSYYCRWVTQSRFLRDEVGWGARERKVIAERLLSAEAFEAYCAMAFEQSKLDVAGDWDEPISPYAIDPRKLLDSHHFTGNESDEEFEEDDRSDLQVVDTDDFMELMGF